MRVIWLIGGHAQICEKLESVLNTPLYGVTYLVRRADSFDEIPKEHLGDSGVALLFDAFSPFHPGFEGLAKAREAGFKGKTFLFGEPGPEMAGQAIRTQQLTGYFASFDRLDIHYFAGVIHNSYCLDGKVNLMQFLRPGGRSAEDQIRSLKEFNHFGSKLGNFVGRFGVDLAHLRKVLMGLSLGHVKTGVSGAQMDDSFVIQYGMDPSKIVLVTTSLSKGADDGVVLQEFSDVVSEMKSVSVPRHLSMFPEMHHVARSSENMLLMSGSAKYENPPLDPMYLFTVLPFPSSKNEKISYYQFVYSHVQPSAEMDESLARLTPSVVVEEKSKDVAVEEEIPLEKDKIEVATLQVNEMNELLAAETSPESSAEGISNEISYSKYEAALSEIESLKMICTALGEDVKRLMTERRQPSTDKELREAFAQIEINFKELSLKNQSLSDHLRERTEENESLKRQLEELKKAHAA